MGPCLSSLRSATARHREEKIGLPAVEAIPDWFVAALFNGEAAPPDGRRGAKLGVKVKFLKQFLRMLPDPGMETWKVVQEVIKPRTSAAKCRFADLKAIRDLGVIGDADAFASHTWGARFRDLVSAVAYVLEDEQYVWCDIFAVLQWNEEDGISEEAWQSKLEDLKFDAVVADCGALILCAAHLETVAAYDDEADLERVWKNRTAETAAIPAAERKMCAFWRVWCLVELAAALASGRPVVMLVGATGPDGEFVPKTSMLDKMESLVDVGEAEASFPSDVSLILDDMMPRILGVTSRAEATAQVNALAIGAIRGASVCMYEKVVLQAALGNLAALQPLEADVLEDKMRIAALSGFTAVVRTALDNGAAVDAPSPRTGMTALLLAASGGHLAVVTELLARGAEVDLDDRHAPEGCHVDGRTPLIAAAFVGSLSVVQALLAQGANLEACDTTGATALRMAAGSGRLTVVAELLRQGGSMVPSDDGATPLHAASCNGHFSVAKLLLDHQAEINAQKCDRSTALMMAACNGQLAIVELLLQRGADVSLKDRSGDTAIEAADFRGQIEVVRFMRRAATRTLNPMCGSQIVSP
eukprot:gene14662-17323_t